MIMILYIMIQQHEVLIRYCHAEQVELFGDVLVYDLCRVCVWVCVCRYNRYTEVCGSEPQTGAGCESVQRWLCIVVHKNGFE